MAGGFRVKQLVKFKYDHQNQGPHSNNQAWESNDGQLFPGVITEICGDGKYIISWGGAKCIPFKVNESDIRKR